MSDDIQRRDRRTLVARDLRRRHRAPVSPDAVVQARGITKLYGQGDACVHALAGVDLDLGRGAYTAIMGPSGLGQVDADARARRPRPAVGRQRVDRRPGDHHAQGARPHAAAARQDRLHLPDVQPAAHAQGAGEHRPAADHRRAQGRRGVHPAAHRHGGPARPPRPQAGGALRRPAAARGRGARARLAAGRALRRRAHGQPRLAHRRGGPAAPARRRATTSVRPS